MATTVRSGLWHDKRMVWLVRIGVGLLSDAFRLVLLLLRSSLAVRAENLVLRKQLAQYIERRVKPRRVDSVARSNETPDRRLDATADARSGGRGKYLPLSNS